MSKVTIITHLCVLRLTPPYPHHLDSDRNTHLQWSQQVHTALLYLWRSASSSTRLCCKVSAQPWIVCCKPWSDGKEGDSSNPIIITPAPTTTHTAVHPTFSWIQWDSARAPGGLRWNGCRVPGVPTPAGALPGNHSLSSFRTRECKHPHLLSDW